MFFSSAIRTEKNWEKTMPHGEFSAHLMRKRGFRMRIEDATMKRLDCITRKWYVATVVNYTTQILVRSVMREDTQENEE